MFHEPHSGEGDQANVARVQHIKQMTRQIRSDGAFINNPDPAEPYSPKHIPEKQPVKHIITLEDATPEDYDALFNIQDRTGYRKDAIP